MSLGVMRQAVCLDSFTMDSLALFHDDPLTITAADLLDDFQAIESSPDLSIDEYFYADFSDYAEFSKDPLSPIDGTTIDSMFHLQTIESPSTPVSGIIDSHTAKFDLTCSTQTSPAARSPKTKTGLLTPLTTSLSFFDDPDETDGESQNETSVNPAVLRKKIKRVKPANGKVHKSKKSQHIRTPSKPKTPRAGSWNVRMEVHMSHSESGRLVVSNTDILPAQESRAGGICPTPNQMTLDHASIAEAASFADQLELMEFQLMDPKQLL